MRTLILLFPILISAIEVKENVTEVTEMFINETTSTVKNNLKNDIKNEMKGMQRITQPTGPVATMASNIKEVMPNETKMETMKSPFRASPQLEGYVEYNRFPVQPVWGEPKIKTMQQLAFDNQENKIRLEKSHYPTKFYAAPSSTTPNTVRPQGSWSISNFAQDKQSLYPQSQLNGINGVTGKPIRADGEYSPLKFYDKYNYGPPTPPAFIGTPTAAPYEWYNAVSIANKPHISSIPSFTKPEPSEHPYTFASAEEPGRTEYAGYSTPHSIAHDDAPEITYPAARKNGWKKVVKFLTAIIPLGILISALTPNVLNIGPPYNATQYCRKYGARLEDGHEHVHFPVKLTFECPAKELCELSIIQTPTIDTVRKIFDLTTILENETNTLELIANAVEQKKCDLISCSKRKLKKRTERRRSRINE